NHTEDRAASNDTEASWRDAALLALLFYTGLRVSGLTGARMDDLTTEAGRTILRSHSKGGQRDFVPVVAPALRPPPRYLELRARQQGKAIDRLGGPLLATSPHPNTPAKPGGKALRQRDVWQTLRRMARQAGLPDADSISPHTARR